MGTATVDVTLPKPLRRLEQRVPDAGCLACRDRRGRIVFAETERLADGSLVLVE
jgi:hypothetical protein